PLFTDAAVLVSTADGLLLALDRFDGAVRWSTSLRAQVVMPMVEEGGTVYVGTNRDEIFALDLEKGEPRWVYRRSVARYLSVRGGAGVAVEGERVFAGFSDGAVVALAVDDGRILWEVATSAGSARRFRDSAAIPAAPAGTVYARVLNRRLYALECSNAGRRLQRSG